MEKLPWNEQLNIGVEVVDKAHARLFRMVGKLMELVEQESDCQNACKKSIKFMEDYTVAHFSEEEAYMRSVGYKDYDKHKKIHDNFRDNTLVTLKKYLEQSEYSPAAVQHFLNVLSGWLTGHIMVEDQAITGNVAVKKYYDVSFDIPVVAAAITQAIENVFHLKSELVSADYNGRSIQNGYYYRLSYDSSDKGKVQLLLGLEERLARRGVGMMLGLSAMQKTEMIRETCMQILEQFLHYLGKLFKSDTEYSLSKEKLLTKDDFRKDFMTRYDRNLLFETRAGHFIFLRQEVGSKEVRHLFRHALSPILST